MYTANVSVIVPTAAAAERFFSIQRAIRSIRASSVDPVQIIAVVNGPNPDANVCTWLGCQTDIVIERQAVASLPLAIYRGRELVKTPYFSFLDDDDEYLPLASDIKLRALLSDESIDVVVTSGYRRMLERDHLMMDDMGGVKNDALKALFSANWLASCNALYRTGSIGVELFADYHAYAEWTWLAFSMAMKGKRIAAVELPSFRIHDTESSLSKSDRYYNAYQGLYERMLRCRPPQSIEKLIRRRMGSDWHERAVRELRSGRRADALYFHVKSLTSCGGLRYLPFTRYLIPGWRNP